MAGSSATFTLVVTRGLAADSICAAGDCPRANRRLHCCCRRLSCRRRCHRLLLLLLPESSNLHFLLLLLLR